jgi:periplasmic divalent cation tolerance protein
MSDHVVITTTTASVGDAENIARLLVRERLAACVQVSTVRSFYIWQGEEHAEPEALLTIKTRAALQERVRARILELNAYDVPEVIATPVTFGSKPYLDWIDAQTESLAS